MQAEEGKEELSRSGEQPWLFSRRLVKSSEGPCSQGRAGEPSCLLQGLLEPTVSAVMKSRASFWSSAADSPEEESRSSEGLFSENGGVKQRGAQLFGAKLPLKSEPTQQAQPAFPGGTAGLDQHTNRW